MIIAGTLTEGATVGRHQEPLRRVGAGADLGTGAGLGTCPGMRKTMEDMPLEVPEVAVRGIRNNCNLFFNCTIVIEIQFIFKNKRLPIIQIQHEYYLDINIWQSSSIT